MDQDSRGNPNQVPFEGEIEGSKVATEDSFCNAEDGGRIWLGREADETKLK